MHTCLKAAFTGAAAIVIAACASSGSGSASTMTQTSLPVTQVVQGTGAATGISLVSEPASTQLKAALPLDIAWLRLQAAYTRLGIKVTTLDQSTRTIGNTNLKARRKIGDVQLRTAINCGGPATSPNAESYELTLVFQSRVIASDKGGVIVETFVNGSGQNPLTNTGNTVPCYSMGVLEKRILAIMMEK